MENVRKAARRSIKEVQHQIKNQAQNSFKPRSSTHPIVEMENVPKPRLRSVLSVRNSRVHFQDELKDAYVPLGDFTFGKSNTCRKSKQCGPEKEERTDENGGFMNNNNQVYCEEAMTACCVEMEDVRVEEEDFVTNSKLETRF